MMVRIAWGGGTEKMWEGTIGASQGAVSQPRQLGIEADEPGSMWIEEGRLQVRQRSPRAYDGVDIIVAASADAKLQVQLTAADDRQTGPQVEIPLADISSDFRTFKLDGNDNRLLIRRTPGDSLLIRTAHPHMVFSPGETLQLEVIPHLLPVAAGTDLQIQTQLLAAADQHLLRSDTNEFRSGGSDSVPLKIKLPSEEGIYDVVMTVQQNTNWARALRPALRWKRSIAERKVQVIVLATKRPTPAKKARELSQIVEIDPANPHWSEKVKLPPWARLPRSLKGPLGNGMRTTIQHALGEVSQLKPNASSPDVSWEAYTLGGLTAGRPHVLEVDYPSDVPQTLGISILEANATGSLVPIGLDAAIDVAEAAIGDAAPHWEHHRVVFWPRTSAPLVLISNRRDSAAAVYGKIRLLGGWEHLPAAAVPSTVGDNQRLLAAYIDRPLLPENFAADEVLDPWSGRALDDWKTFHQAGTRLVEYLHFSGYNGLMLTVAADGSAIYPSQVLGPTPRYDSGVFFATGQDPLPKDVLEMLLRLMDREELQLIPSLEFASPLPALEEIRRRGGDAARGIEWIGGDGNTWCQTYAAHRGLAPYYNTLDPRVQDAMLAAVREVAHRYAGHRSFRGLALRLSAYGYAQLPGPEWGVDDATIARFERDAGVRVPGSGPKRYAARAAFLADDENRLKWLQWRAAECQKFYRRVREEIAAVRADMPLYLAGAEMLAGPELEAELRPALPRRSSMVVAFLNAGIDLRLVHNDSQVVLLRSQRFYPSGQLTAQALDLELAQMPEAAFFFRGLPQSGSLFFHPPQELHIPSFDKQGPFKASFSWLLTQTVPSGQQNRRRFIESLAAMDSQILIDGGWMLPLGQDESLRTMAAAYRQLPPVRFADAADSLGAGSVVFRYATHRGKTYAYAVNDAPFATTAQVRVSASANCTLNELSPGSRKSALKSETDGLWWTVTLDPYDLVAVELSEAEATLASPQVSLPKNVEAALSQRIKLLSTRAVALRSPPPLNVLTNAGFQSKASEAEPVPGWTVSKRPGVSIVTDTSQGHTTSDDAAGHSARISSDGPIACLVSQPFNPPKSGRITMSVWLRTSDAARQPNLRLAVEGKLTGRDYYRFAAIGQPPSAGGQMGSPIGATWGQYIVQFDDLPLEGLSQMRVRIDLMGAGQVWADDVQLFDLAFNETELRALYKIITLADVNLRNGQVGDCMKLLDGYWPRFLMQNVPAAQAVPTVASKPAPPPAVPPPDSPGWLDRVKGILPDGLR